MLFPYFKKNILEAGCDEAGRGCLAGPVVAAAVIFPWNFHNEELNDSKKLSSNQRIKLKSIIISNALAYGIGLADNQEIDKVNILKATFIAMHRAIGNLKIYPEHLIIDGNRFTPYEKIPYKCIIKGDGKYMSIAAASILAKTYRDELMLSFSKDYPKYGWEKNAGYPTKTHRRAIEKYGITPLHRKTFRLLKDPILNLGIQN